MPGPVPPSAPSGGWRGTGQGKLAALAAAALRMLRLAGSRCCLGRADAAWQQTVDRE